MQYLIQLATILLMQKVKTYKDVSCIWQSDTAVILSALAEAVALAVCEGVAFSPRTWTSPPLGFMQYLNGQVQYVNRSK
jgi:hypothetical protein